MADRQHSAGRSALRQRLLQRAEAFDTMYSRFRRDTLISQMAAPKTGGRFQFPDDGEPLFLLYDRLYRATLGAVDPLVGRDLELQKTFAEAVPRVVVGKPLGQVKVGKLAGSSGTPKGFNDALRQIKAQAERN